MSPCRGFAPECKGNTVIPRWGERKKGTGSLNKEGKSNLNILDWKHSIVSGHIVTGVWGVPLRYSLSSSLRSVSILYSFGCLWHIVFALPQFDNWFVIWLYIHRWAGFRTWFRSTLNQNINFIPYNGLPVDLRRFSGIDSSDGQFRLDVLFLIACQCVKKQNKLQTKLLKTTIERSIWWSNIY